MTSRGVIPEFDKHYMAAVREAERTGKKHSITSSLIYSFGPMFFTGAALKVCSDLLGGLITKKYHCSFPINLDILRNIFALIRIFQN